RRFVVESILQPSAVVAPHYVAWRIETKDGKVRTGMLTNTTLDEYTYLDEKGNLFKVNTRDVVEARSLTQSIMPAGVVGRLTDQELRDLMADLCARRWLFCPDPGASARTAPSACLRFALALRLASAKRKQRKTPRREKTTSLAQVAHPSPSHDLGASLPAPFACARRLLSR